MVRRPGDELTVIFWNFVEDKGSLTGAEPGFLAVEEKRRLSGFRFEKRRKDWLLGRWTAKVLLMNCCEPCAASQMDAFQICAEESGAPYAADLSGNRFPGCLSISHREGASLCAFTQENQAKIGADLEWIEPKDDHFFEDYFTEGEQAVVRSSSESQRSLAIALVWSVKESVLKAMGTGLRIDTRNINVNLSAQDFAGDAGCEWRTLLVSGSALPGGAVVRWKVYQNFVFTLASLGNQAINLKSAL